jgi:hypothetical protein
MIRMYVHRVDQVRTPPRQLFQVAERKPDRKSTDAAIGACHGQFAKRFRGSSVQHEEAMVLLLEALLYRPLSLKYLSAWVMSA